MSSKHQKHPKLSRPDRGFYHKLEWGIYGTTCGEIKDLMDQIVQSISQYNFLQIDADHHAQEEGAFLQIGEKQWKTGDSSKWNEYDDRMFNWNVDAVLVNGNHYPARRQIVFINPKKKDSLFRRIDQLTQVDIIILQEKDQVPYDFLMSKIDAKTKIYTLDQQKEIAEFIEDNIKNSLPKLKALILAGGKSSRMGEDKSQIEYHSGITQEIHLAKLCQELGLESYISKSLADKDKEFQGFEVIHDKLHGMGPFGAILTAFMTDPDAAWLILACDIPLLSKDSISDLIEGRNTQKFATCYRIEGKEFPEPLISIYEPRIYQRMLRFMSLGYACPRKVLINSDVEVIQHNNSWELFNANTPSERDEIMKKIEAS